MYVFSWMKRFACLAEIKQQMPGSSNSKQNLLSPSLRSLKSIEEQEEWQVRSPVNQVFQPLDEQTRSQRYLVRPSKISLVTSTRSLNGQQQMNENSNVGSSSMLVSKSLLEPSSGMYQGSYDSVYPQEYYDRYVIMTGDYGYTSPDEAGQKTRKNTDPYTFKETLKLPFRLTSYLLIAYLIAGCCLVFPLVAAWTLLGLGFLLIPGMACMFTRKFVRTWKLCGYYELKIMDRLLHQDHAGDAKRNRNRTISTNASSRYNDDKMQCSLLLNDGVHSTIIYLSTVQVLWKAVTMFLFVGLYATASIFTFNSLIIAGCGQTCYSWINGFPELSYDNPMYKELLSPDESIQSQFVRIILANCWGTLVLIPLGTVLYFGAFILMTRSMEYLRDMARIMLIDR